MSFLHTHKTRLARGVWEANIVLSLQAVGRHHWLGVAGDVTGHHHPSTRRRPPRKPGPPLYPPLHHRQGGGRCRRQPGKWGWGDTMRRAKRNEIEPGTRWLSVGLGSPRLPRACRTGQWCCRRVHVWDETFISPRYCSWALSECTKPSHTFNRALWKTSMLHRCS